MKQYVFINYRRSDTELVAQFLEKDLAKKFGQENIFFDREIEPGSNFVEVLQDAVGNCHILLALIGPTWLSEDNKSRLHLEDDWVRIEIATALARKTKVIPVYLRGASVPNVSDLPPDLAGLVTQQAVFLKGDDLWSGVDRLSAVIEKDLKARQEENPATKTDNVDDLIRRSRLIKAEADQLYLDVMTRSQQFRFGNEGVTKAGIEHQLDEKGKAAHKSKLEEAYGLLLQASELEPANPDVLLATAQLLVELTPDDTSDEQKLLFKIKSLISDPKNDTERFQLAKATFLLASSGDDVHEESLMDALATFEDLGRYDWVRRCDALLSNQTSKPPPPESQSQAAFGQQPPDSGPYPQQPPQPQQFQPAGSWQICDAAFCPSTWNIDFYPNGGFQGQQETPAMGIFGPVTGTWGFDPYQSAFSVQGILNGMMPFGTTIFLQRFDGKIWYGVGSDGMPYSLMSTGSNQTV